MRDKEHLLSEHDADLLAMSYGFRDAADMKAEGERLERERLISLVNKGPTE